MKKRWARLGVAAAGWAASVGFAGASITSLGDLPGGFKQSTAHAVSADGKVVVGVSNSTNGQEAFRWTESGGMEPLGDLAGGAFESRALAVSADGSVVVGWSKSSNGTEAFRWTSVGMMGLGDFEGNNFESIASGVSADGSVVVGRGHGDRIVEGFRWTSSSGMVGVGDLPGGVFQSNASAISANSSVVVGESHTSQAVEAFRLAGGVMTGLGQLSPTPTQSRALAVSADGNVVVGVAWRDATGVQEAFRWTDAGGMVGLGNLEPTGRNSLAHAVSGDGSIVVGESDRFSALSGVEAFIWDAQGGMRPLAGELTDVYGIDLTGWTLDRATGISDDGKVIVGTGFYEPEGAGLAWRAVLTPAPRPQAVTYRWAGPLKIKESTSALATYHRVPLNDIMEGTFTIGATELGSTFVPPGTYEFPDDEFFGTIDGMGTTISTEPSSRPLEVSFLDDYELEPEELEVLNTCLGTDHPPGTRIDLAEIEVDFSFSVKRLEFGVSLGSLDLDWIASSDYRTFPSLDEVDLAVYFIVEERLGAEVFNAVGLLTEFEVQLPVEIVIKEIRRQADVVTIVFESAPGLQGWQVLGDATLNSGFPDLLGSNITEDAGEPGRYTALVNVAGQGETYFLRVER